MQRNHVAESEYHDNLIIMWAAVHGLAAMANMKGFQYSGDWGPAIMEYIPISIRGL